MEKDEIRKEFSVILNMKAWGFNQNTSRDPGRMVTRKRLQHGGESSASFAGAK